VQKPHIKKRPSISKLLLIIIMLNLLSACSTARYYAQGASGHMALMSQRQPLSDVLQDSKIPLKRKNQIKQVQSIRKFAYKELKLPKNNSYTSYVDLKRDAISWNVIATPKYSIDPIQTCFPITGCVSYLLYFSKERAEEVAKHHQNLGHDTHIIASPAYSTRGIFDDPIVSTMFKGGTSSIAQIVFHELAHQQLYRNNDSNFNEAFASTVGLEGTRLWLQKHHPKKVKPYNDYLKKRTQFFNLLLTSRNELQTLYKSGKTDAQMKIGKQNVFAQLQHRYTQLKKSWHGDKRFDAWFKKHPVNNAKLAVIGVYFQKVPEFSKQLKLLNYDFEKFYQYYFDKEDLAGLIIVP
jgi:predicted aminopeptidase